MGAPSTSFSSGRVFLYTPCGAALCYSTAIAPPYGLFGLPALGNAVALSAWLLVLAPARQLGAARVAAVAVVLGRRRRRQPHVELRLTPRVQADVVG